MSDKPKVHVTIRLERGRDLDEIVANLAEAGLDHIERRDRFAMVNGEVAADKMSALRDVGGVESVREDRSYGTA
jgi:hypothetical protein